ncbi:hypothetical protein [Kitasatospora sp. MAP5-34]|uniref:hypothetical protein n=1 Tax=Kitasatospora sp. MAP5-34 TaxID=3035102 RepID=UPI0024759F8F|nr:hypothetical protein [Kitasatospora sp. MAP5-34]MDH6577504.1 hypothetical protein [Kitasatospora sp. MAP5-34]
MTMADQWEPAVGEMAYDRRSGRAVKVMAVHSFGVFVRPVKGGRESITKLRDLIPPDDAPGGLHDWQVSRG